MQPKKIHKQLFYSTSLDTGGVVVLNTGLKYFFCLKPYLQSAFINIATKSEIPSCIEIQLKISFFTMKLLNAVNTWSEKMIKMCKKNERTIFSVQIYSMFFCLWNIQNKNAEWVQSSTYTCHPHSLPGANTKSVII